MQKRERNIALGALLAAGIGYAAGILTAPKSGRETRRDIQRAAVRAKTEAEKNLKIMHSELDELIDQAKHAATSLKDSAADELSLAVHKAQKAKQKAREILSAIHEGDADDRDLQKAVTEVNKAIEHLKSYMEKRDGEEATS
jgi:gas vesicle protein